MKEIKAANMKASAKIAKLRELMIKRGIDAFIIPSSDPHISEYPATHWKSRMWLSGFTGSAGSIVVTTEKAGLWTDSRYFIQAELQLKDTGINLFKDGLPETPSLKDWLISELSAGSCIAIDGDVYAASEAQQLKAFFEENHIQLDTTFQPFDLVWNDRPGISSDKIFIHPEKFSGMSTREKIDNVLKEIRTAGADITILAALDAIAWLFNIRGNDVDYNPVAVSYAVISSKEAILFINQEKLTTEVSDYLKSQQIILSDYNKVFDYVKKIAPKQKVLVNPAKINYSLYNSISGVVKEVNIHPVDLMKAVKNKPEIAGFKNALQKDGVAWIKFYMWLENALNAGEKVTELDIIRQLKHFRSEQPLYFGESFGTIAGYGAHGAIVHYEATEESNATIEKKGLILIDSGAQYFDGTTDITRTIAVGDLTEQMCIDYTLVLKGHIALSQARFPQGTKGCQLDILARKAMWDRGLNYLHGTGHGIGHFLNVHEAPPSIRTDLHPTPLQPGMIMSNEPGLYRTGKYGIRLENMILTVPAEKTDFGSFYQFEILTLCPIDTQPIRKNLLSDNEIEWLNKYHLNVYEKLSPLLNEEEIAWLKRKTKSI